MLTKNTITNMSTMLAEILKLLCPNAMLEKHPNSLEIFPRHSGKNSNKLSCNASKFSQFTTTVSESMKFYFITVAKILRVFLQMLLQRMIEETMNLKLIVNGGNSKLTTNVPIMLAEIPTRSVQ